MSLAELPFRPIRGLYSSEELISGFDGANPRSFADILDFRVFRYFVMNGRAIPSDSLASMMEALHDNSISQATFALLRSQKCIAAVMGGHEQDRGSAPYRSVVQVSRALTNKGFQMASGGGPGAMEATYLGAFLSAAEDAFIDKVITTLANEPTLPDTRMIVSPSGEIDFALAEKLHKWTLPAFRIFEEVKTGGWSLAVPTWQYGHEPFSPFASHVAKYFQNSIREDGLLALAAHGVIYAPGKAGTLQEVFQDAAQNYYHSFADRFSPMVFLDVKYWTETLPVKQLLENLFVLNKRGDEYKKLVLFTDDVAEVVDFLVGMAPSEKELTMRWKALGLDAAIGQA